MTDKILVVVSCGSVAEADLILDALLEARLVACGHIGAAMQSKFFWKGRLESSTEFPLTLKTRAALYPRVEAEILRRHSYENPEILALPVIEGSSSYLRWLDETVASARGAVR